MCSLLPRPGRGASLTELLVVVGIVVVLAALAVPAALVGPEVARRTVCAGRLHTIYAALVAYMADYDRKLPIVWFIDYTDEQTAARDGLPPLRLGQDVWPPYPPAPSPPRWYSLRYAMNDYINDPQTWFCPSQPRPPARLLAGPESCRMSYWWNADMAGLPVDQLARPPEYAALVACPDLVHLRRQNVLYLTGVVRWTDRALLDMLREPWDLIKQAAEGAAHG